MPSPLPVQSPVQQPYSSSKERSVHGALCAIKQVLESHLVVPKGGAVETALSVYLENFARTLVGVVEPC